MAKIKVIDLIISKWDTENKAGEYRPFVKGLSAVFESGKLNMIMGPKNSGKTILLTSIYGVTDENTEMSGEILVDEQKRTSTDWYSRVSLVDKMENFHLDVTVLQALKFSLNMKNARSGGETTLSDCRDIVEYLQLDKLFNKKLRALSSGEQKCVMMASELIFDKEIILLDEPISNIDPYLAHRVIYYLKSLATEKSKMIIFTAYNPCEQVFKEIDNILFMVKGCAIYDGPVADMDGFLQSNQITPPTGQITSNFLVEEFYKTPYLSDHKSHVTDLLYKIFIRSRKMHESSNLSNKSSKFITTTPNLAQTFTLVKRFARLAFLRKGFIIKIVLLTGIETTTTLLLEKTCALYYPLIGFVYPVLSAAIATNIFKLVGNKEAVLGHCSVLTFAISAFLTELIEFFCTGILAMFSLMSFNIENFQSLIAHLAFCVSTFFFNEILLSLIERRLLRGVVVFTVISLFFLFFNFFYTETNRVILLLLYQGILRYIEIFRRIYICSVNSIYFGEFPWPSLLLMVITSFVVLPLIGMSSLVYHYSPRISLNP